MEDNSEITDYKIILDSVHGRLKIPKDICKDIVDTSYFQRLRRIEQNSCRSVFPSARHDRFIHSLGVFHIGCAIVKHLTETSKVLPENWDIISQTYKIACLLHDVGHTPFSHTFEEFYDNSRILKDIQCQITSERFKNESDIPYNEYTPHELLSAWVAISVFKDCNVCEGIEWELLVRMVIGLTYKKEDKTLDPFDFRNIMIELIHGTIDADGLDYVCRDVWAGGYQNFSVDIQRIIDAIDIIKVDNRYVLAFKSKALNEIETVLNVKNFQYFYVINHHKVLLEQHYLVEGVKIAACYHFGYGLTDKEKAISMLCNHNAFIKGIEFPHSHYTLCQPCDDDFISLMKSANWKLKNHTISQWFSREYSMKPLWKSKIEFYHIFQETIEEIKNSAPDDFDEQVKRNFAMEMISSAVGENECVSHIKAIIGALDSNVYVKKVKPKLRHFDPSKIKLIVKDTPVDYSKFIHEGFVASGYKTDFYYWYVTDNLLTKITASGIIAEIKNFIKEKYSKARDSYQNLT